MTVGQALGAQAVLRATQRWSVERPDIDPMWRAVAIMAVASLLVPVLVGGILAVGLLSPASGSLPPVRAAIESGVTRVYDATGAEIATFQRFETTVPVSRDDIPAVLNQAVVAAEDRRFYSHGGVDSRGILRALWANIQGNAYEQGGSTITQQYVRLAYTGDRRTLGRKIHEARLARKVEAELDKEEILYRYLSRAYFGNGAYGIGAAAERYFHKSARDLTLSESALLAGLLPAPSQYNPRDNPREAEAQRMGVLQKMQAQGAITPVQLADASAQRVVLAAGASPPSDTATVIYPAEAQSSRYPWFTDYVRRYLVARYGDEAVHQDGLRVETSLDPGLQAKAEASAATALKGTRAPLSLAMVVIDPKNGLVRAMVGGRDFAQSQVNLALGQACPDTDNLASGDGPVCVSGGGSGRQPGSAFKPITLARAFERGLSVDTRFLGPSSYTFPDCRGKGCTVNNIESGSYGSITLRDATAYSVNTVFAQLVEEVGVKETAELANRLGLTTITPDGTLPSGEPYGPSLTLGAAEVSPLDMAAAYGVFAARGMRYSASPVIKVVDADGKVLEDNAARAGKRVLAENVADRVTDVLTDVVGYGSGKAAEIGRPDGTAGKTGTSEGFGDAWFVGYTPSLVTSVWMGYADSRKPLVNISGHAQVFGGTIPARTWHDFMISVLEGVPPQPFTSALRPPPQPTEAGSTPPAPEVTVPSYESPVPNYPDPATLESPVANFPDPANLPLAPLPEPTVVKAPTSVPPNPSPGSAVPCLACLLTPPQ